MVMFPVCVPKHAGGCRVFSWLGGSRNEIAHLILGDQRGGLMNSFDVAGEA